MSKLKYSNLSVIPGVQTNLGFSVSDETGIPLVLTGYTFRLEFYDSLSRLVLLKDAPASSSTGVIVFQLSSIDGAALVEPLYRYRLVLTSPGGDQGMYYTGYLKVDAVPYDPGSTPGNNIVILPDGTVYPLSAITLAPNVWYAAASFFRLVVTGVCTMGMDARDIRGNIAGNIDIFQSATMDPVAWTPPLNGNTAFRINVVSGGATVQYLP